MTALIAILAAITSVAPTVRDFTPEMIARCKRATALIRVGETSEGTAFHIGNGLFMTNQHVISKAMRGDKLTLILDAGELTQRSITAVPVRQSPELDLALIRVDQRDLPPFIPVEANSQVVETTQVAAFGFPFGSDLALKDKGIPSVTVNVCRISALAKEAGKLKRVQLDATLNPGNSGGPVINTSGQVIGVVNSGIVGAGVTFAIPPNAIGEFLHGTGVSMSVSPITFGRGSETSIVIDAKVQDTKPEEITVRLKLSSGAADSREFKVQPDANGRFSLRTALVPKDDPDVVTVEVTEPGGEFTLKVKDKALRIGTRSIKLSAMKEMVQGISASVTLANGQQFSTSVGGLLSMETVKNGAVSPIDLSKANRIRVVSGDSSVVKSVLYEVVVSKGSTNVVIKQRGEITADGVFPEILQVPDEISQASLVHRSMVIAAPDEWMTTESAIDMLGEESLSNYLRNVGKMFSPDKPGNFLIYSTHWTFGETFRRYMILNGHKLTVSMSPKAINTYDAIFVGGDKTVDRAKLLAYVRGGGKVYIAGATGFEGELSFWNEFLDPFGMQYVPYRGSDNVNLSNLGNMGLFNGVRGLHMRGAWSVIRDPAARGVQLAGFDKGLAWFGIYDAPTRTRE